MGDAPIDPNAATLASDSDVASDSGAVTSPDALPVSLGSYEILTELGRGGMGSVYLGKRSGPGGFLKLVAIKRIHPHLAKEGDFVAMFLDEARVAASIQHANVAQVFELLAEHGQHLLIMEYVHGVTLDELIRASDAFPVEVALTIASGALAGLHAAHTAKDHLGNALHLVHRDVTPHNIFLTFDGDVKLSDFGVARAEGRLTKTETGRLKGKAAYMSPEQLHGKAIDARLDVFSMGVVLWEMLTGQRLFVGDSQAEIMMKIVTGTAPPPSEHNAEVSPELDALVRKALDPNPDERFQSARDMQMAVDALRSSNPDAQKDVAEAIASRMPDAKPERDAALTTRRGSGAAVHVPSQSGIQLSAPKASNAATDPEPAAPRSRAAYFAAFAVVVLGVGGGAWLASDASGTRSEPAAVVEARAEPTVESEAVETVETVETEDVEDVETEDVETEDVEDVETVATPSEGTEQPAGSMRRASPMRVVAETSRTETSPMQTMETSETMESESMGSEPVTPTMTAMQVGHAYLDFIPTRAAEVFINGRSYGWTPMRRREIPAGDIVLVLRTREGDEHRVPIHTEPGQPYTVPRDRL